MERLSIIRSGIDVELLLNDYCTLLVHKKCSCRKLSVELVKVTISAILLSIALISCIMAFHDFKLPPWLRCPLHICSGCMANLRHVQESLFLHRLRLRLFLRLETNLTRTACRAHPFSQNNVCSHSSIVEMCMKSSSK